MSQRIVLASGNPGKIIELQAILQALPYEIVPQSQFNIPDADETGFTFIENALIKARQACEMTGLPAIADDSGLCIDALQGAPGIYSARYAGPGATQQDLINKVLNEMQSVSDEQRQARFHCMIVFLRHAKDPDPIIAHGTWNGLITREPIGEHGIAYDPIFFAPEFGCTAASLPPEKKFEVSHRGRALQQLCDALTQCSVT